MLKRGIAGAAAIASVPVASIIAASASSQPTTGLRGVYGFLTYASFAPQPEADIRNRIATMAGDFGVREFQFYDWFADYSTPTRGDQWTDAFFRKSPISRRSIEICIDEIHKHGGRAWAYVQAVAAEENDLADPQRDIHKLIGKYGKWYWHAPGEHPRFPTYFANAAWARFQCARWLEPIAAIKFDGVHWDTLGAIAGDRGAETAGIHAFLATAKPLVEQVGLKQALNFVDMAWWNRDVARQLVEFPYVEAWSQATADRFYSEMEAPDMQHVRGVMAMYPTTAARAGVETVELIRERFEACKKRRLSYLIVGDGARRMKNEYWPNTVPLSPAEVELLRVK
jgi:hypothetical protein